MYAGDIFRPDPHILIEIFVSIIDAAVENRDDDFSLPFVVAQPSIASRSARFLPPSWPRFLSAHCSPNSGSLGIAPPVVREYEQSLAALRLFWIVELYLIIRLGVRTLSHRGILFGNSRASALSRSSITVRPLTDSISSVRLSLFVDSDRL